MKTNSKQRAPTKSEDATSTTEETYSPGADSAPYDQGNEDSPISIPASQSSDVKPENAPHGYRVSGNEKEKNDTDVAGDFVADLNLDRRKRRKIRPSIESQGLAQGDGNGWLHQLPGAPTNGPEQATLATFTAVLRPSVSPKAKTSMFEKLVSPSKSPRRDGKDGTRERQPNQFTTYEAVSPPSVPPTTSTISTTMSATPKKKLLRLSANGKLLSSPTTVSPVSKRKGRRGHEKHGALLKAKKIVLKYGSDPEGRLRIGNKINELLSKQSTSKQAPFPQDDGPPRATHPFFLGKYTERLDASAHTGGSEVSSRDQVSEAEDKPRPAGSTVAWKDIVFTSHKAIPTPVLDATGAPWPPMELQHLGAEVTRTPPSSLKLRSRPMSKSKEQRTQITPEEDVIHSKSDILVHWNVSSSSSRLFQIAPLGSKIAHIQCSHSSSYGRHWATSGGHSGRQHDVHRRGIQVFPS